MSAKRPPDAGFTIVETVIVLAVAGLILLVVLLAVPALQRSSHNNERKQDVQSILAAVSNYKLNNSGCMPNACGGNFLKYAKLFSYTKSAAYIIGGAGTPITSGINVYSELPVATAASESNTSLDTVDIHNYRKCSTDGSGSDTNAGAGFGDVVALYSIEDASGNGPKCQQM